MDDRSEELRLGMADTILERIVTATPTDVIGDLNSMHRTSWSARVMRTRAAKFAAEHVPSARAKWLAARLVDMADGRTMSRLITAGLREADSKRRATFTHTGIPFGQLDHILTSGIAVSNFTVHKLAGSDHRAVSARLES